MTRFSIFSHRLSQLLFLILIPICFFSQFRLFRDVAANDMDPSWAAALGYFLIHHFSAGLDYCFTFGPLGALYLPQYVQNYFWSKYAWELGIYGALVAILIHLTRDRSYFYRAAVLLTISLVASNIRASLDATLLLLLALSGVSLLRNSKPNLSSDAIATCGLAALAYVKFTFFVYILCILSIVTVWRLKANSKKDALRWLCFAIAAYCALWILLRQPVTGFFPFLRFSWVIARQYSEALAVWGEPRALISAILILVILYGLILRAVFVSRLSARVISESLLISLSLFLAWKEGFVRQDMHVVIFYGYAVCLASLFPVLLGDRLFRNRTELFFLSLAFFLGVGGFLHRSEPVFPLIAIENVISAVRRSALEFWAPAAAKDHLERSIQDYEDAFSLPQIKSKVGQRSVDIFSYDQGIVFLNHLRWRPRPVFQSNLASSPDLQKMNADFLQGPMAPDFLLYRLQTIDDHFPSMEEGPTLLLVLSRYRYVLKERGYLLLERKEADFASKVSFQLSKSRELRFSETFKIEPSDKGILLAIDIRYTFLGKILTFLFKAPPVTISVRTKDGFEKTFNLLPGMAKVGFLLSPLLTKTDDVEDFYHGQPLPSVSSIIVGIPSGKDFYFFPTMGVALGKFDVRL